MNVKRSNFQKRNSYTMGENTFKKEVDSLMNQDLKHVIGNKENSGAANREKL